MKMKDYPCLYQLATTDISVQCDFFCSLSSIFQLTIPEIIEYSKLFAHASQGILFNGTGLSFDLIESFGKKRLAQPFSTCKTLVSAFSNYNLKLGACQICPLSSNF